MQSWSKCVFNSAIRISSPGKKCGGVFVLFVHSSPHLQHAQARKYICNKTNTLHTTCRAMALGRCWRLAEHRREGRLRPRRRHLPRLPYRMNCKQKDKKFNYKSNFFLSQTVLLQFFLSQTVLFVCLPVFLLADFRAVLCLQIIDAV